MLPVTENIEANDFGSTFSHGNEAAESGYYQVYLERYGVNAELTATLDCGFHKYTYPEGKPQQLVVNLSQSNERVRDWNIEQDGDNVYKGVQNKENRICVE